MMGKKILSANGWSQFDSLKDFGFLQFYFPLLDPMCNKKFIYIEEICGNFKKLQIWMLLII